MERINRFSAALSATVLVATIGGTRAMAQTGADPLEARDLTPIVRALDAEELAQREAAVDALVSDRGVTLREILGILSGVTSLSPEQRARLLVSAREMFIQSPRAALGVQFGGTVERGVAIQSAVDGFDSARVLRPGDVVLAANGVDVTQTRLRAIILSHDPGESMVLRLQRTSEAGTEEIVESRVTLGSMNRLRGGGFIDAGTMMDAWRERLARAGVAQAPSDPALQPDVDHGAWLASAQASARSGVRETGPWGGPGTARAPIAAVSGEPRTVWADAGMERFSGQDDALLEPMRLDRRAQERAAMIEELTGLQRELMILRAAIRGNSAALEGQTLTDAQRARLTVENRRLQGETEVLEARMGEIRARLNRQQ